MNGKKARALRKANGPKPAPDYPVYRTRPLIEQDGRYRRFIGHVEDTGRRRLILTANGGVSQIRLPDVAPGGGRPNRSHERRVRAAGRRSARKF